jgi:hypothetical protein
MQRRKAANKQQSKDVKKQADRDVSMCLLLCREEGSRHKRGCTLQVRLTVMLSTIGICYLFTQASMSIILDGLAYVNCCVPAEINTENINEADLRISSILSGTHPLPGLVECALGGRSIRAEHNDHQLCRQRVRLLRVSACVHYAHLQMSLTQTEHRVQNGLQAFVLSLEQECRTAVDRVGDDREKQTDHVILAVDIRAILF